MERKEIISILRGNCGRLVQIMDNHEMSKIYEATDEAVTDINRLTNPEYPRKQIVQNNKQRFTWHIGIVEKCPNCSRILPTEQYLHCPYCGQMINWEGGIYSEEDQDTRD